MEGLYTVKWAGHPHDRIEERTPLHRSNIGLIQKAVDTIGLSPGSYHLPLRGKDGNVLGYAVFKAAPNKSRPVLSTVYAPHMPPPGQNIETALKTAATLSSFQTTNKVLRPLVSDQSGPDAINSAFNTLNSANNNSSLLTLGGDAVPVNTSTGG